MAAVPRVSAAGVDPESLATLPAGELRAWVTRLLHGRVTELAAALTDEPEGVLLDIHRAGSAALRGALSDAVLALLEDMAWHTNSPWRAEASGFSPGDRLVWVARGIGAPAFAAPIAHMAKSGDFVGKPGELRGGLHARLLQALVAVGVTEDEGFWREQMRTAPKLYLVAAMRGLAEAGNPFVLLREAGGTVLRELQPDLVRLLDVLRAAKGSGWLREAIRPYRHLLPPEVAAEVADLFPRQTTSPAGLSEARRSPWAWELPPAFRAA